MFLVDTNVFIEILLRQSKKEPCKIFLSDNIGNLNITDFTLHSIGVILFRHEKRDAFNRFLEDALPKVDIVSLPVNKYKKLVSIGKIYGLDFDDAYQYATAQHYGWKIVTMDNDFKKIDDSDVVFL